MGTKKQTHASFNGQLVAVGGSAYCYRVVRKACETICYGAGWLDHPEYLAGKIAVIH